MAKSTSKHSLMTRLAHAGLGVAIVIQLLTSLVMQAPYPNRAGDVFFGIHSYSGLGALGFVFLFWVAVMARRRGTSFGLLIPWFSRDRIEALWRDMRHHLMTLLKFKLPAYDEHGPLASAVHGLGLLLMTAMAASGTLYFLINTGNPDAGGWVAVAMFAHKLLANLVWAYLIGHAGLAVIHHYTQHLSLSEMWSFRRGAKAVANQPGEAR